MLSFCLVTPTGALIGMQVRSDVDGDPATNAVVAMAGGSFIYIGLMEIIAKELGCDHRPTADKFAKILLVLLGWAFMAAIAVWT